MRLLYLDCSMGAAGDMLMAALYELMTEEERRKYLDMMNRLIPGVSVQPRPVTMSGIAATHMDVRIHGQEEKPGEDLSENRAERILSEQEHQGEHGLPAQQESNGLQESYCQQGFHGGQRAHDHQESHDHQEVHDHQEPRDHEDSHGHQNHHGDHEHHTPESIREILQSLPIPDPVREQAEAVYHRIAEAEAAVHGKPVEEIHFHEVGALDAVADITGVCLALHLLHPDRILVSPVRVGSGQVRCAHGILPVPAPATARLLTGIPSFGGDIPGELCTPTGAALIGAFADEFGPMPEMIPDRCGYGAGTKELPGLNCVRAILGSSSTGDPNAASGDQDAVSELCCHIDDMTAEALAFAGEQLMEQGALDVSVSPLLMKKGRSGYCFTVICRRQDEERMAAAVLRETSTNGMRVRRCGRYILKPSIRVADTSFGPIRIKCASGSGIYREKPEYEDVAAAARERDLPFRQVWEQVLREAVRTAE